MKSVKIKCAGKINLSLNVLDKRDDGYHYIDSLMQSVDLCDILTVKLRHDKQNKITFKNALIDENNNSIKKTLDLVGVKGLDIEVEKNLPISGGMGGSSANVAGTIFALKYLLNIDAAHLAAKIGSDVPFMLAGGIARVSGIGEIIEPIDAKLNAHLVIIYCDLVQNDSGKIYSIFDKLNDSGNITDNENLIKLIKTDKKQAFKHFDNALTKAASIFNPQILTAFELLKGADKINLTGSGSCVYGCFSDQIKAKTKLIELIDKKISAYMIKTCDYGLKLI